MYPAAPRLSAALAKKAGGREAGAMRWRRARGHNPGEGAAPARHFATSAHVALDPGTRSNQEGGRRRESRRGAMEGVLTRARGAQVIAASIAILPPDSLAEVVKYIVTWETRSDVLALRCASKFCRHAVRRGIAGYSATSGADQIEYVQFPVPDHRKTIKYHLSERDARRIEARVRPAS